MSLVSSRILFEHARKENYAIPCMNIIDVETLQAIIDAAQEEDSPVMLSITPATLDFLGVDYFQAMAKVAVDKTDVPIAIHLDHGKTLKDIMSVIRHGFTSVMIDASSKSFEENIELTNKVIELARLLGITVEAELGQISGKEDVEETECSMTDPDAAKRFVELTNVDALAVSIGNAHGVYKENPQIDMPRLKTIINNTDSFIVLHGGSGTPRIPEMIERGIVKVNINADLQVPFRNSIKETIESKGLENIYAVDLMIPAREAMKQAAKGKMRLFGSSGQGKRI